jgi:molybdopterin-guanine dinucleotide biosynthesis protein A
LPYAVYDHRVSDIAAFILAGGASKRMGRDKASLTLGGKTLLERALGLVNSITRDVAIIGNAAKFGGYGRIIEDIYPGCGPLGGIHAALRQTRAELNLMLALDTPFIEEKFLHFLVSTARECGSVVTVPRTQGQRHPLCAVYRRDFVSLCEEALARGQNKIDRLFAGIEIRMIDEEEMIRLKFSPQMFRNLNTPEEWNEAQMAWNQEKNNEGGITR